ncbi:DUF1983 domain-containing protein [Pectobacterium betavasculorum]|uniref:TipJ family phage tail tip protein n=1 Tax=Pectobacterium betavasculorum TaxID=55207 RepID=UPI00313AA8DE
MTAIKGRKGGSSSSRTPVEQPDDLQSVAKAKLLLALGEGEFAGGLTDQTIFLDGTALKNSDGSSNFSGVAWEFRPGTQAQAYIQGMPSTENEVSVGAEIKSDATWSRTYTNTQLSAVRVRLKWPSLFKQEDNGDLVGYSIRYAIDLQTDGGSFVTVVNTAVTGKTTSGYERSHRIDLPQAGSTWTVRLRRLTTNANSAKIGDAMTLQSYTEVIDAKLRYPNTALLYIEFDSSQFNGSIPQISCEPKGRVIRVPDNYDPIGRTYSGTWSGIFKWAWTDNPAWIFYDIVISDRFGLGQRLTATNIDKWELYRVAQYCDQPVPDGKGGSGTEPRYKCDVYVQQRNDAYTVLRDFAAIFRGMTYWGGNQIVALADMPRDVDYSYTRANVIDGLFTYSSSTTKTRYTTALVSWTDPDNGYSDAMEPVFEQNLVARYGFNQLEVTAIGCTRQSEANRKGRWGILTNNKDRVVTFSVGLDGMIPQPGYIIAVADELLSGKVTGGRISSVNGRVITLDRTADAVSSDRLILNLPSGAAQSRTIQSISGPIVTVTAAYSEVPERESVWVVESDQLYAQQYRVVSIADNNDNTFTISAAYHDPDKYARIDTGAIIDERPISVVPPGSQQAPADITIETYSVVDQGISVQTMRAVWAETTNAISYEAQWRRNEGNWVSVARSSTTSFEVPGIYAGRYVVRVRAINAAEISSPWANSQETTLNGKDGNPPALASFTTTPLVFGIQLDWNFPPDTADTLKTEIQYSATSDGQNALLLSDVSYPSRSYQQMGLSIGQEFFYRARIVDKSGNQGPWTGWVRGESSTDVSDITEIIVKEVTGTDAWKSLIGDIENNSQQIADHAGQVADGMRDSIEQAKAIIRNSLANDSETRRWRAQNGDRTAEITETRAAVANEVEARTIAMLEMQSQIGTTNSNLNALQQTVTTLEQTTAQDITSLNSKMTAAEEDIEGNSTAIGGLQTTVSQHGDKLETQSSDITQLSSSVNAAQQSANNAQSAANTAQSTATGASNAVSALDTKVTQQGNTITSQGTQITQITASVGTAQQSANNAQSAANAAQNAANAAATAAGNKGGVIWSATPPGADKRLAQNLWMNTANNANTPNRWNGTSWAPATDKAATDAQAAANAASNAAAAAQSTANGAVQSVNSVSTTVTQQGNTIAAQGTQINTLTATVNGVSAEISDVSSVVNGIDAKISAYRSIKVAVDANGRQYIAGIGLDVSNSQAGMQANIIMLADRFTMMTNAGGVPAAIFTNQGTQVILRDVVIGTATIDGTKIKNATITGAHIQNLSVDFAKITDTLKSSDFETGRSGWNLPKSGDAELNDVTVRGTIYAKEGEFDGTIYANRIVGGIVEQQYGLTGRLDAGLGLAGGSFEYVLFKVKMERFSQDISLVGMPETVSEFWGSNEIIKQENRCWSGMMSGDIPGSVTGGLYIDDNMVINFNGNPSILNAYRVSFILPSGGGIATIKIKYSRPPSSGATIFFRTVLGFNVFKQKVNTDPITPVMRLS